MKNFFQTLFKMAFILSLVYAAFAVIQRLTEKSSKYIEIYNDDDDWEGELY